MQNNKLEILIAPCGANCTICMAYIRSENSCPGCRASNVDKPLHCSRCRIKGCEEIRKNELIFCFECEKFPCYRLKKLDTRYRANYSFSMIDNLMKIKKNGLKNFIEDEIQRWTCGECGGIINVHRGYCNDCGEIKYRHKGTNRARIK